MARPHTHPLGRVSCSVAPLPADRSHCLHFLQQRQLHFGLPILVSLQARVVYYHQPDNFHGEASPQHWLLAISNTRFEVKSFSYLVREVGEGSKS